MTSYQAQHAYQDSQEATSYDSRRFKSWRGRIGDTLDKRTLLKAIKAASKPLAGPLRILDCPCGTGRITRFLLDQGHNVTGADISQEMMDVALTKVQQFSTFGGFYQADASHLEFGDNSFDCVVCIRFMGHIPPNVRIQILREFRRVSSMAIIEYSLKSRTAALRRQIDQYVRHGRGLPNRWAWNVLARRDLISELRAAQLRLTAMWPKARYVSDSWYVLVEQDQ